MQEMIDKLAADVGIDADLAHKATSMIVNFVTVYAPAEYVDSIRQYVPGFDEVAAAGAAHTEAASTESSGGGLFGALGGLMGGGGIAGALGSLMGGSEGGGMAAAMSMLGNLQKDGLDMGQMQGLAGGLLTQLREAAGPDVVDKLVAELPGIGRFLA
jgi:hypothetical protein